MFCTLWAKVFEYFKLHFINYKTQTTIPKDV